MDAAEQYVENLLSTLGEIVNRYNDNYKQIKKLEGEALDLLHKLEFSKKLSLYEGFYVAKRIREIRRERRKLKEENETLFYLFNMVNKNPQFKNELIKTQGNIKKKLKNIEKRKYWPRVLEDMNTGYE